MSVRGHGGLIDTVYTVVRRLSRTKPEQQELSSHKTANERTKESELLTNLINNEDQNNGVVCSIQ